MSEYVGLVKGKVHDKREMSEYYCCGCGYPVTDHDSYCRECGGALHEGMDKSRWAQLFGTPERAARTYLDYFLNGCDGATCGDGCPFFDTSMYMNCALGTDDYDALLEWLRGDA